MSEKYEFDAERFCLNNEGRLGTNWINGEDIATSIAKKIAALKDESAQLRAELAALKEAARPVVKEWRENPCLANNAETGEESGYVFASAAQLDELARLCGEE